MVSAKEIKALMDADPFRPFKIHLSDGSTYEVPNHDAALETRNYVEVGLTRDPDGISERITRCATIHINRIEDLQPA
jgi:hypothetical protein